MSPPATAQITPGRPQARSPLAVTGVTTCSQTLLAARRPGSPHPLWIADVSQVWGGTSWLYFAFVLDGSSGRCIGFSSHRTLHCELLRDAVRVALVTRRGPIARRFRRGSPPPAQPPAEVAIVFDQRCRTAGLDFPPGALRSASEAALSRGFIAALRRSLGDDSEWWPTQDQARSAVRAWIDNDYNPGRPAPAAPLGSPLPSTRDAPARASDPLHQLQRAHAKPPAPTHRAPAPMPRVSATR